MSNSVAYTQNFDGIGTSATATLPTEFRVDKPATVRTVGTWAAGLTATSLVGGANLSTSTSNGIYNFGAGTTTTGSDRAVGFLSSGTATASGNLYLQLANNTGAALNGLQISYNVEKYRGGTNAAGFRVQLFYSTDGSTWTIAPGSSFTTSFAADATNNGFSPAPGVTTAVSNQVLTVSIPDASNLYLAWNYSVASGTTTTNAQALAIDDISILGVGGIGISGSATPGTVQAGNTTLLKAVVIPAADSTGIAVVADLTAIGGSATQQFFDDGTHGDSTAGDNTFSFLATVSAATPAGSKSLPVTAADAQSRSASTNIALSTTAFTTPPSGTGSATPSSIQATNTTLLKVAVSPGSNPTSLSYTVTADLSTMGGLAAQPFYDDGTHGDVTSGDGIFSFLATANLPPANPTVNLSLPVTITDDQARSSNLNIALTVNPLSTPPTGTGTANPVTLQPGASTLLTVTTTPGANPTSTGITVKADLSSIGGSAAQAFADNGSGVFTFTATVDSGTVPGNKSLPVTISDGQSRSGSTTIALSVQFPPAPTTVKISQAYGGGGNSGSTYKNDFIELFNQSNGPVDISHWSVQTSSATSTSWTATNLCTTGGTCILQPGHYYLVQEGSGGTSGTTNLPTADIVGTITTIGAGSGKVALVDNTTVLSGACPTGAGIADLVAYGGTAANPNCFETSPAAALSNTLAAVRKNNGCVDTDNNANDFLAIGPIPRNSLSPVNLCGGDATQPSGIGTADPSSIGQTGTTVLTVAVTPATSPASTGLTVTGNLAAIDLPASQQFYDDGTHGDVTAGDNIFSFGTSIPLSVAFGAHSIPITITDSQGRTATAPITLTLQSPTCGVERWSVKVGTDAAAQNVDLLHPINTTITNLRAIPAPSSPIQTDTPRMSPTETSVFVIHGTMTLYKLETDVDYHIVMQESPNVTMVTEIPSPACDGNTSPFDAAVAAVRAKFDSRFTATSNFQTANVPVQMKGVGFFDLIHGQTGVAPNGIELHPILDFSVTNASTTVLSASANPASFGQPVILTATVNIGGAPSPVATGNVSFFEGATLLGVGALDNTGKATFTSSGFAVGTHNITASYEGDAAGSPSLAAAFPLNVNPAVPVITWTTPASIVYGSALSAVQLNATTSVPGTFVYTPGIGTVLPTGNGQTLSVTFTPSSNNYVAASKSVTIDVLPASGGGSPANLVITRTLARVGGEVVATITIANTGGTAADSVTITSAKIGTTAGTPLPQSLGSIAAGGSVQTTITFPGSVGTAGAASTISVAGTYAGGTFSSSGRITLP